MNEHYYWNLTKKYTVAFESIFKDLKVKRYDENHHEVKSINVPRTFAGKRKISYYLQKDTDKISVKLPRIGFIINDFQYDASRKTGLLNEIQLSDGSKEMFNSVPYNLTFTVSILTKYLDDMMQIIEQIVPKFTPDYVLSVNEIPELGIKNDIIVILDSVNPNTQFEYDEISDRIVAYDLTFTLRGNFYPPTSNSKIIETINVNIHDLETQKIISTINHQWNQLNDSIETTITEGL